MSRLITRLTLAGTAALGAVVLAAAPASAHVLIEQVAPTGNGTTAITLMFEHGCDGSPTVGLDVTLPDGVAAVATSAPDGWDAQVEDGAVRWEGSPVVDGDTARFTIDATVTGSVGETFVLPTVQRCETGENDWTEEGASGTAPAPRFVATGATLTTVADVPAGGDAEDDAEAGAGAGAAEDSGGHGTESSGAGLGATLGVVVLLGALGALVAKPRQRVLDAAAPGSTPKQN